MSPLFPRFTPRGPQVLDLAPLVDIVFTLVLFFLLTSSFVAPAGVAVDVPEVANAAPLPGAALEVHILKDDRLVVGGRELTLEAFRREVRPLGRAGRPVLISGDRGASLGRTLEVWDACKEAGVRQLHVRTRGGRETPKSQPPNPN
jgi:biopolymer transport protein ExbD